jgi:hypothetical protein
MAWLTTRAKGRSSRRAGGTGAFGLDAAPPEWPNRRTPSPGSGPRRGNAAVEVTGQPDVRGRVSAVSGVVGKHGPGRPRRAAGQMF